MVAVARRIERPYRVRFDEAGADGRLRASGFLRYGSDIAWLHSELAGFGREWYAERHLTWLIRAIDLRLEEDVPYGTEIIVSTQVIGFRRVWARRRIEFRLGEGQPPVAVEHIDWVLLGGRGGPARIPHEIADAFVDRPTDFAPLRLPAETPPPDAAHHELGVRRRDLDPMGHVNNAAYVDYLDELFAADTSPGLPLAVPRRYQGEFVASAEPGATLRGYGWTAAGTWHYRLEDAGGRALFQATLDGDAVPAMDSGLNI